MSEAVRVGDEDHLGLYGRLFNVEDVSRRFLWKMARGGKKAGFDET